MGSTGEQASGCSGWFVRISGLVLAVSVLATVVGLVLVFAGAHTDGGSDGVVPISAAGALLASLGLVVLFGTLLVTFPVVLYLSATRDASSSSWAPGLRVDWRRAGTIERAGLLVAVPLLVLFFLSFDMVVVWLALGTIGGTALADDYVSSGERLSSSRRRSSAVMLLGCLVYLGSTWFMDEAAAQQWGALLLLLALIVVGVIRAGRATPFPLSELSVWSH